MKRNYPQHIKEVIGTLFKDRDMESSLLMHRALGAWPQVVGPMINRQTTARRVDSGVLYVQIASSVIRQELNMHKADLLAALNRAAGADVLNEIRFF
ncbi:MAG: DUF721 domain-containing protein [Prevotella sp.]|nr:DUF721 domain-containing protein [Prevotella sp.]MCM1074985.1 DUF721 domain-containing protein [Ruminococcus sp.]